MFAVIYAVYGGLERFRKDHGEKFKSATFRQINFLMMITEIHNQFRRSYAYKLLSYLLHGAESFLRS